MKINLSALRPSSLVRDIENGFIGLGEVTRAVAVAAVATARDKRRSLRNEYRARTLAAANLLADKVNAAESDEALADLESIRVRTDELIKARSSRKAA